MESSRSLLFFSLISLMILWLTILFVSSTSHAFNSYKSISPQDSEAETNQPALQIDSPLEEV